MKFGIVQAQVRLDVRGFSTEGCCVHVDMKRAARCVVVRGLGEPSRLRVRASPLQRLGRP